MCRPTSQRVLLFQAGRREHPTLLAPRHAQPSTAYAAGRRRRRGRVLGPAEGGNMQVTVLGAGSWGTTVASLVAQRNQAVLWARNAEQAREITEEQHELGLPPGLHAAEVAHCTERPGGGGRPGATCWSWASPRRPSAPVLTEAAPFLRPWVPVVSLTKGLEQASHLRMTQVIEQVLPGNPAAALTGPNLAKEIMAGNAASSVVATRDLDARPCAPGRAAPRPVPRLHQRRRGRLRARRRAQERDRHRGGHGRRPQRR